MWVVLCAVFMASSAAAVIVPWLRAGAGPQTVTTSTAPSSPTARLFVVECASAEICDRMVEDVRRRLPATDADSSAARAMTAAIAAAVRQEPWMDCPTADGPCGVRYAAADPTQVKQALIAAGFPGVVVRTAGADDPAPVGAVAYYLRVRSACVLGYLAAGAGPSQPRVEGLLPNGSCQP
jgi:hypothetical protein